MKAKWVSLPTKRKVLLVGLLLWVVALCFGGVAFLVLGFVLHKDYDIIFYISALALLAPILVIINKERYTWREVAMRFGKAITLVVTGFLGFIGGIQVGLDIARESEEAHPLYGEIMALLFTLISFFWWIYFTVKAGQQLIPKTSTGIGGKKDGED